MGANSPLAREPVPVEQPTPRAELRIWVSHARARDTAKSRVPPDHASYMIMTCGVLGSVVTGTAGMVLTLRISPGHTGLALAELALTLTAVVIIAVGCRSRETAGHAVGHGRPIASAGTGPAQPGSGEDGTARSS